MAGVALGDIYFRFAWQAWHLWHWAGSGGSGGWHDFVTHHLSPRHLSHTTLSHTIFRHTIFRTQLCHTHHLSSSHTIFHTQVCHTQLCFTCRSSTTSFVFPSFPVPATTCGAHCWKKLPCGVIWSFNYFFELLYHNSRTLCGQFHLAITHRILIGQIIFSQMIGGHPLIQVDYGEETLLVATLHGSVLEAGRGSRNGSIFTH